MNKLINQRKCSAGCTGFCLAYAHRQIIHILRKRIFLAHECLDLSHIGIDILSQISADHDPAVEEHSSRRDCRHEIMQILLPPGLYTLFSFFQLLEKQRQVAFRHGRKYFCITISIQTATLAAITLPATAYQLDVTGTKIESEYQLISIVREMAKRKKEYDTVSTAVEAVRQTGYGVIAPQKEEIRMEEPQVMKQGSRYGVKIRATSPSVHLIRADIETEIAPIVGSEQQAKDLIEYMKQNEQEDGMWNTLIFGKSVEQMIEEGIQSRLSSIGEESQLKLQDTMKRIVNESKGRIICIIL